MICRASGAAGQLAWHDGQRIHAAPGQLPQDLLDLAARLPG
jgi:hypothetical protein